MAPRVVAFVVYSVCFAYFTRLTLFFVAVNSVNNSLDNSLCRLASLDFNVAYNMRFESTVIGNQYKRQRLSAPISYYTNSSACFRLNLQRFHPEYTLLMCGDIHANPGPVFDIISPLPRYNNNSFCLQPVGIISSPFSNIAAVVAGHLDPRLATISSQWHPALILPWAGLAVFQTPMADQRVAPNSYRPAPNVNNNNSSSSSRGIHTGRLKYSSSDLRQLRHSRPPSRHVLDVIDYCGLKRHYRGTRGGRLSKMIFKLSGSDTTHSSDYNSPIPIVVHRRPPSVKQTAIVTTNRERQLIEIKLNTFDISSCTTSDDEDIHPNLYLLNTTSLKKPHALQHLTTDIHHGNYDIVFITESWLSSKQQSSSFDIPGYILQRRDRVRRVGGGLCTYIRNNFTIVNLSRPTSSDNCNVEILWTHCISDSHNYFLANCYYPPKPKHTEREFVSQLSSTIEYIMSSFSEPYFIIAGDFNSLDTTFLETNFGFFSIINSATHGKRILDKIFISWPSSYTVRVINSLVKTKHKAVTACADRTNESEGCCCCCSLHSHQYGPRMQ